jgi:hypothetical protein
MAVAGYFLDQVQNYREILLGFEPGHGTLSSADFGGVLLGILQQHQIVDRVIAITTGDAPNNITLTPSIQESVRLLELNNNMTTIRIPGIAHVIQLSLKQLPEHTKANPKNETAEMALSEARIQSLHVKQREKEIIDTRSGI